MSSNTIDFVVTEKSIFSYEYRNPSFANDFVREVGVVTLSTNYKGKEVEVTLQTGESYVSNNYDHPNPFYEVSSINIEGKEIARDQIEDNDLAIAISLLEQDKNNLDEINYNREPEGYLYSLRDLSEENFAETYEKISYEKMKEKMQTGNCEIIEITVS